MQTNQNQQQMDFNAILLQQATNQNQFLNSSTLNLEMSQFESSFKDSQSGKKQEPSPTNTVQPQTAPPMTTPYADTAISMMMTPDQFQMSPLTPLSTQSQFMPWNQKRRASYIDTTSSFDLNSMAYPTPKQRPRSNSLSSFASESSMDDAHRASFLERNRKAAMKCRLKKKNYLANLEQSVERLTKENKELQELVQQLRQRLGESDQSLISNPIC